MGTRPVKPARPPGWSDHAAVTAWFQSWWRAIRSNNPASAQIAAAQLRELGVEVAPVEKP